MLYNKSSSSQLRLSFEATEDGGSKANVIDIDPGEGPSGWQPGMVTSDEMLDLSDAEDQLKEDDQSQASDDEWGEYIKPDTIEQTLMSHADTDLVSKDFNVESVATATDSPSEVAKAPDLSTHDYKGKSPVKQLGKAGDPNFLSEFYSNSRLHHLSMWRSELKNFATMIHQNAKKKGLLVKKPRKNADRLIVHIDLDSFFVSVALKEKPELRGKPVAVCHGGKGGIGTYNLTFCLSIEQLHFPSAVQTIQ